MELNGNRLEMLERRFQASEGEMARMRRRLRATWTLALAGVVGAFVLGGNPEARAQVAITMQGLQNQINSLKTQVNDQNTQINSLKTQVSGYSAQISSLNSQVANLQAQAGGQNNLNVRLAGVEAKTAPITVSGSSFVITGKNVFIQDGSGSTSSTSGLGNLTVGYNAGRTTVGEPDVRSGSHNLILGDRNDYSSFGGLVAGYSNTISGQYASITGGTDNTASGQAASVSGGYFNTAWGLSTSVSGGKNNRAGSSYSSVSGGYQRYTSPAVIGPSPSPIAAWAAGDLYMTN